jgi:copper chaperone CopZ
MTKIVTLKIQGMECPNCSLTLERIEDSLKGILYVEASYRKAQMQVEYDERLLNLDQIKAEIQRLGYEVVDVD